MKPLIFLLDPDYSLGQAICRSLDTRPGGLEQRTFPDGESYLRLHDDCADTQVVVIARLDNPDTRVLRLLMLARILKDEGARRVGLVAPYLPYMRQDHIFHPGEGLTSLYFADLISRHFDWLVTVDPHLHRYPDLSAVYSIPSVHVRASTTFAGWIRDSVVSPAIVGPDSESAQWVEEIATLAGAPRIVLSKTRRGDQDITIHAGDLSLLADHTPILVDDIVSSGETMAKTVALMRNRGMVRPVCAITHALFAPGAAERLRGAGAGVVVSTNSVPHDSNVMDLSPSIAEAVDSLVGDPESGR